MENTISTTHVNRVQITALNAHMTPENAQNADKNLRV